MPEEIDVPRNIGDIPQLEEFSGYEVREWHRLRDGQGPPEQVHLLLDMGGKLDGVVMVLRMKTRRVLDELVAALQKHGNNVWPPN